MFHPVGPQPPSVYWRRRLLFLGSVAALFALLIMTVKIATSNSDGTAGAQVKSSTAPAPHTSTVPQHSSPASQPRTTASAKPSGSSSVPPAPCMLKNLAVSAVAERSSYQVGDQPVLELQVTNTGTAACVQDLADKQVELRVYNGESRVWGSHDCKVQPGTAMHTLSPNTPVRVAVQWSGLSSQQGCAGTRQRVGAGTYTLYAFLAGQPGKAAVFSIG